MLLRTFCTFPVHLRYKFPTRRSLPRREARSCNQPSTEQCVLFLNNLKLKIGKGLTNESEVYNCCKATEGSIFAIHLSSGFKWMWEGRLNVWRRVGQTKAKGTSIFITSFFLGCRINYAPIETRMHFARDRSNAYPTLNDRGRPLLARVSLPLFNIERELALSVRVCVYEFSTNWIFLPLHSFIRSISDVAALSKYNQILSDY